MSRSNSVVKVVVCLLAATSWSCARGETCVGVACGPGALRATGTFQAKAGSTVSGTATLVEEAGAVTLTVQVKGAKPGLHGIHFHEKGDCSAPDFSSAGGHFNPTDAPHACPPTEPRHAGDLGNIEIGADGTGRLEITSARISLAVGPLSVIGRALILHDAADDCSSQPTGHSGGREACAVIVAE